MGKNIDLFIKNQEQSFFIYIRDCLLDRMSWELLHLIMRQTNTYVFSGVIRNFFLGNINNRDLDIVVEKNASIKIPLSMIRNLKINKNSFGGLKVKANKLNIDFWYLQNTWGIKQKNIPATPKSLISTAFFNFSAIVYDLNKRQFVYGKPFCDFLKYRNIDILYKDNPNVPLCLVNIIYYYDVYGLSLSKETCDWFVDHYETVCDYTNIQRHHWNYVRYDNEDVWQFYLLCRVIS